MALRGQSKMVFDEAMGNARSHMSWVEKCLTTHAGDIDDEGNRREVQMRTAAASAWAQIARAAAAEGARQE